MLKLARGIEPPTPELQIQSATSCATPAFYLKYPASIVGTETNSQQYKNLKVLAVRDRAGYDKVVILKAFLLCLWL